MHVLCVAKDTDNLSLGDCIRDWSKVSAEAEETRLEAGTSDCGWDSAGISDDPCCARRETGACSALWGSTMSSDSGSSLAARAAATFSVDILTKLKLGILSREL